MELDLRAKEEVEAAVQDLIVETKCPICLDFFTNPRSAPCQHNFCEVPLPGCTRTIKTFWRVECVHTTIYV